MVSKRLEKKEKTRRALIEAALALSLEKGFSAIGLREVSRVAGIAPTSFYRHFRSMDELSLALVEELSLVLHGLLRLLRYRLRSSPLSLNELLSSLVEFVSRKPEVFRLIFSGKMSCSQGSFFTELHREYQYFLSEFTLILEQTSQDSQLKEVDLIAQMIITIVFNTDFSSPDRQDVEKAVLNRQFDLLMRAAGSSKSLASGKSQLL